MKYIEAFEEMPTPLVKVLRNTKLWISRIRLFAIVLTTVTGIILFVVVPYNQSLRMRKSTDELVGRYGLVVRYKDPEFFFIPPMEPIDATKGSHISFERVDKKEVPEVLEGVVNALRYYPPALVKKYLSAVFVVGKIKIYDVEGAATFAHSWIYIAAPSSMGTGSKDYAISLHHEFSSLLFYGAKFPVIPWHLVNPPDFSYLEKHEDIIKAADRKNRIDAGNDKDCYESGFVSEYGMSSMENDFNTYVEMVFGDPDNLSHLMEKYLPIKRKTDLLVKFYTDLEPGMCDYFISVGLVANCPEQSN